VGFYQKLVYDNWIFDMAKIIDIVAVYGKSNIETVQKIILNLFESDKRYVQDFKECLELMVTLIKKTFKEYHKIQTIIKGEYIREMTQEELKELVLKYLTDYSEILSNLALIAVDFPEEVLETLRSTNCLIYLANSYCLTLQLKKELQNKLNIYLPSLKNGDRNLQKLQGYAYVQEI